MFILFHLCFIYALVCCFWQGNINCNECRNYKDGPYCVAQCPSIKYADFNKECQPCAEFCSSGCTGPSEMTVPGGCNSCEFGEIVDEVKLTAQCINPQLTDCQDGFYRKTARKGPMKGKNVSYVVDFSLLLIIPKFHIIEG